MDSRTTVPPQSTFGPTLITWLAHACIMAAGCFFFLDNKADVDLWGNVGFVRSFPWQADFLYQNTYSYAEPDSPWVNHEWLSEWVLYKLHATFGNAGLLAYKFCIGFGLLYWMNRNMRKQGCSGALRFFLLLLILSTVGYGFGVRPHLGTFVLMAAMVEWLQRGLSLRGAFLPVWVVTAALWANWHGAFFVGAILLLLNAVTEFPVRSPRERVMSLMALLAFLLGTLLTPFGPGLWSFVVSSASILRPFLSEWAPLNLEEAMGVHIDFVLLALLVTSSVCVARKRQSFEVGLLLVTLIAGVSMRRNIAMFALVAGLVSGRYVQAFGGSVLTPLINRFPVMLRSALCAMGAVFFLWATLIFNKSAPFEIEVDRTRFPVSAMALIQSHEIHGNAIVFFDWAEQFIWHRQGRSHVFLDGRFCSAYTRKTMDDYQRFIYGLAPWDTALTDYPTDMVLIHQGNPANSLMRERPEWAVVYEDELCSLFLRRDTHRDVIQLLQSRPVSTVPTSTVPLFP